MFKVIDLDHVVLNVKDVDRMTAFYSEGLGLELLRMQEYKQGKAPFPSVRVSEGTIIDFFPPERHRASWEKDRGNMNHLCLVIEKADFERVVDHLKKTGAEMHLGPVPRWGARGMGTSIYFYDPEGNMVEIRQY